MKLRYVFTSLLVIYFITLTLRLVNIPKNVQWWADSSRDYLVSLYLHNTGEKIDLGHYANGFAVPFHYPPNYYYLLSNFHYVDDSQESMMVVYAVLASTIVIAMFILAFSITRNHRISLLASFLLGFSPYLLIQTMQFHGSVFVHWLYIWSLAFFSFGFTTKKDHYILLGMLIGLFVVSTSYVYAISLMLMGFMYLLSKKFSVTRKITVMIIVLIATYSMYFPVLKTIPNASLSMVKNISWEVSYKRSHWENIVYLVSELRQLNYGFSQPNVLNQFALFLGLLGAVFLIFKKQSINKYMNRNILLFLIGCGLLPILFLHRFSNTDVPAHWFIPTLISIQILILVVISLVFFSNTNNLRLLGILMLVVYSFSVISDQKQFSQREEKLNKMHVYARLANTLTLNYGSEIASGLKILSSVNGNADLLFEYDSYRYLSEFSSNTELLRLANYGSDIESKYSYSDYILRLCATPISESECEKWIANNQNYSVESAKSIEEGSLYLLTGKE